MAELNGETKLTFGLKEWAAFVVIIVSGVASMWDTRQVATQAREDVVIVTASLKDLSQQLTSRIETLVRADERVNSLERRVDLSEARIERLESSR